MSRTKIIAAGNQKGGVGKTHINLILASYFHKNTDMSVVAIDLDDGQQTLWLKRKKDMAEGAEVDDWYDVFLMEPQRFPKTFAEELDGNVDLVVIDLPGNMMQPGVMGCYTLTDLIIVPTDLDEENYQASDLYIKQINENVNPLRLKSGFPEIQVKKLLNKIDLTENETASAYTDYLNGYFGDNWFGAALPKSKKTFAANATTVNEFSYYSSSKKFKGQGDLVKNFCEEVEEILNKID